MGPTGGASGSAAYKAPFKFNADVPIDLAGSLYDIKKKLLGTNASTIIQLVDEVGSKNCVRVRMRGIGSGFLEGQQELQVRSLLFCTSCYYYYSYHNMIFLGVIDVQCECG